MKKADSKKQKWTCYFQAISAFTFKVVSGNCLLIAFSLLINHSNKCIKIYATPPIFNLEHVVSKIAKRKKNTWIFQVEYESKHNYIEIECEWRSWACPSRFADDPIQLSLEIKMGWEFSSVSRFKRILNSDAACHLGGRPAAVHWGTDITLTPIWTLGFAISVFEEKNSFAPVHPSR